MSILRKLVLLISLSTILSIHAYDPEHIKRFKETNICPGCDLSDYKFAGNRDINHSSANLEKANLSGICGYDSFSGRVMNLSGSNLQNANFSGANLKRVNLSQSDFTGAALFGATLDEANLFGATLTSEQIAQAKSICEAILPDGSRGACN